MKYTTEIVIDLPRDAFIQKLDNPDNMKHWMRGLLSHEMVSGEPGQEGARMTMRFKMGKREMEMVETIIKRNMPEEIHMTYDTKGVQNIQKNFFKEEDGKTRWISESEFQFDGLGMKIMAFLMPGAFKKQSRKYAEDFKNFAEKGISVTETN
ncbi:MAG: SRPBCC family protein [Bacteroidota bacterium]